MKQSLDLKSSNAGIFRSATVSVSTISMPDLNNEVDLGYRYETCVFTANGSEVVARYQTMDEAVRGHAAQCRLHGVSALPPIVRC